MQNATFQTSLRGLRRTLPMASWVLLIAVYLVSGWTGGALLTTLMGGSIIAYAIGFAIQATRAVIVFFPQMNPNRPSFGWAGEAAAVFFGLLSIYEMYSLTTSSGHQMAVFVSVGVLMFAGIIIEIMMLREVKFATEAELLSDAAALTRVREHFVSRATLRATLEAIEEEAAEGYLNIKGNNLLGLSGASPTPSDAIVSDLQTENLELRATINDLEQKMAALAGFVGGVNGHATPLGQNAGGVSVP